MHIMCHIRTLWMVWWFWEHPGPSQHHLWWGIRIESPDTKIAQIDTFNKTDTEIIFKRRIEETPPRSFGDVCDELHIVSPTTFVAFWLIVSKHNNDSYNYVPDSPSMACCYEDWTITMIDTMLSCRRPSSSWSIITLQKSEGRQHRFLQKTKLRILSWFDSLQRTTAWQWWHSISNIHQPTKQCNDNYDIIQTHMAL